MFAHEGVSLKRTCKATLILNRHHRYTTIVKRLAIDKFIRNGEMS